MDLDESNTIPTRLPNTVANKATNKTWRGKTRQKEMWRGNIGEDAQRTDSIVEAKSKRLNQMKTEKSVKHPELRQSEVYKPQSQTRHGAHTAPIGIGAAIGQGALRAFHHRAFRPCRSAIAARELRPTKLPDRAGYRNRQERDCKHGVPYVDVPTGMWLRPNVVRGLTSRFDGCNWVGTAQPNENGKKS
jgi:hypothetical protein